MVNYTDLQVDQGADFSKSMRMTNADGTPINVASYVFAGQLKYSFFTANASANLVITKTDATNGNISIILDRANTANLRAGQYVYDVTSIDSSNNKTRILQGNFNLNPGVTGVTPPGGPHVV